MLQGSTLNQIDLSLNRSHMTMEDNNKIQPRQERDRGESEKPGEVEEEFKEDELVQLDDPMMQLKS